MLRVLLLLFLLLLLRHDSPPLWPNNCWLILLSNFFLPNPTTCWWTCPCLARSIHMSGRDVTWNYLSWRDVTWHDLSWCEKNPLKKFKKRLGEIISIKKILKQISEYFWAWHEGPLCCSQRLQPSEEVEKGGRRAATFLVISKWWKYYVVLLISKELKLNMQHIPNEYQK